MFVYYTSLYVCQSQTGLHFLRKDNSEHAYLNTLHLYKSSEFEVFTKMLYCRQSVYGLLWSIQIDTHFCTLLRCV